MSERVTVVRATFARLWGGGSRWSDAWALGALALTSRLACVAWAATKFPPAADGTFYDTVARRISQGHGYTWLWPDGAVTYAAHYPVGYPALIGGLYALFGPSPVVAMLFNALLGALAVVACYWLGADSGARGTGLVAGALTALHPSLVFYTPALMTEGVTAALYAVAAWLALAWARSPRVRLGWLLALVLGITLLIRPQTLVLVPVFGLAAAYRPTSAVPHDDFWGKGWYRAGLVTVLALAVCAPWTIRNCVRMDRCVLVSANAGWNLLIGTAPEAKGAWIALNDMGVPAECREVFEEAAKDACFGKAAMARIAREPGSWLALAPQKWGATFDYPAAPAHYLHMSNAAEFDYRAEQNLVAIETVYARVLMALALAGFAWLPGPMRWLRVGLGGAGILSMASPVGWPAVLCLVACAALVWRTLLERRPWGIAIAVLAATALIHAVFFGAGRYALVSGYLAGVLATACGAARFASSPWLRRTR